MAEGSLPDTISHYLLGDQIGSGGMGRVYRALDRRDNTPVAIKLLNPDLADDEDFIRRFEREAHLGTLAYAAPEQATGRADHRTDIYALGATLYHTLIGRPPFEGGLIEALAQPGIPVEPISHLPQPLIEVLRRCLARDPDDRFQSAGMLAAALDRCQDAPQSTSSPTPAGTESLPGAEGPTDADSAPITQPIAPPPAPAMGVAPAAAADGQGTLTALVLGKPKTGPLGGRLSATRYALTITNSGDQPLVVDLQAGADAQDISYELPPQVIVPPRSTSTIEMKVWPTVRRMGGGTERRLLTVAAAGSDGTQTIASTQFQKMPYGLMPFGALLSVGGVAAIAGAVFATGGGAPDAVEESRALASETAAPEATEEDDHTLPAAGNDRIEDAVLVEELPFEDRVDSSEATTAAADQVFFCTNEPGSRGIWYEFVAPVDGEVAVDTGGSDYDTVVAVFDRGQGDELTQIACDDDSSAGAGSYLTFYASKGRSYYIEAARFAPGGGGELVIDVARRLSPIDDFDDAYLLSASADLPFVDALSPAKATTADDDPIPSCGSGSSAQSLWYVLELDAANTLSVTTELSGYDTIISVWTGQRGDLTEVACNDDIADQQSSQSRVNLDIAVGTRYYVMISAREPANFLHFEVDFTPLDSATDGIDSDDPRAASQGG